MEDYYRNFTVFRTFLKKTDREVFLAKPFDHCEGYPEYYVVKVFNSPKEPRELTIHKQLASQYPSVLTIYDSWNDGQCFFMSIEYCEDGDLHKYFESSGGKLFPFATILIYCYQITETVWSMHQLKICHRDIKPLNIYIKNKFENFKLGDFGEAKPVLEEEGYHTITGTPYYMSPEQKKSLNNKVGLIVNPYRDDIWALARTFVEISLGRLCPEMYSMGIKQLHCFIEESFRGLKYDEDFVSLVKKMMLEMENFQITSEHVMRELQRIYFKLYDNNDKKVEESHVDYVNKEANNQCKPDLKSRDREDKDLSSPQNLMGSEVGPEYKGSQPEKVSSSSEESSSFVDSYDENEQKFDYEIKNPFEFKGHSHKLQTELKVSELKNIPILPPPILLKPQISKPAPAEPSKPNINIPPVKTSLRPEANSPIKLSVNIPPFTPEAKSAVKSPANIPNPPILNASNPSNTSKAIVPKKVEEVKSSGVKIDSEEFKKNPKPSNQPKNEANNRLSISHEESKKSSIPKRNSLPAESQVSIEERKSKLCSVCNISITRSSCEMPCKHSYHPNCIKQTYETKIQKMSNRSDELPCHVCKAKVPFNFFERCTFLEAPARLLIQLQIFSHTEFKCPNCKIETISRMLSNNLKARNKKCKQCESNFCTFCEVKGGHRFFCDLLRDLKKGRVRNEKFVEN